MRRFIGRWGGPGVVVAAVLGLVGCNHLGVGRGGAGCDLDGCPPGEDCHVHLKLEKHPTLMAFGHDLDHLEKHIDWFGSATAKVPDVWGQARLTVYREQFEELMDPTNPDNKLEFQAGLQGSLARSDQAFFAQATALSFAAQPKPPVVGRVTSTKSADPPKLTDVEQTRTTIDLDRRLQNLEITETLRQLPAPAPAAPAAKADPVPFPAIPLADPTKLLTDPDNAIKRELVVHCT